MRPSASARFNRDHLILHSCGSRSSLAPIVFQDGRDRVSCFMAVSWRPSGSVHGRFNNAAPAPETSVLDPRLPSLRFGEGIFSLGFGVNVIVEVTATGEAFAMAGGGFGEALPTS